MKQLLLLGSICILIFSCQDRKLSFNPEAIDLNNKACELMKNMMNDSALILLDKATTFDKNYYTAYGNKIEIYCQRKDYKKALIEAENQLRAKPDLAEGWTGAGILYNKLGDTIKAKEYYKRSIEIYSNRILNPDKKEHININRINRALSLILLGLEAEGKKELEKLKAENNDNLMIDELLKTNKQEIENQIFKNE